MKRKSNIGSKISVRFDKSFKAAQIKIVSEIGFRTLSAMYKDYKTKFT